MEASSREGSAVSPSLLESVDVSKPLDPRGVAQLFLSCPETPLAREKHGWGYY